MPTISLELTTEEAWLVHNALKRNKTREIARGGYWGGNEFQRYEPDKTAKSGVRAIYGPRDAVKAAEHRALGEQHKAILSRLVKALRAVGDGT